MQTFQFGLFIFRFQALVLLREVIGDVFLHWLSWELMAVGQPSTFVKPLCLSFSSVK